MEYNVANLGIDTCCQGLKSKTNSVMYNIPLVSGVQRSGSTTYSLCSAHHKGSSHPARYSSITIPMTRFPVLCLSSF